MQIQRAKPKLSKIKMRKRGEKKQDTEIKKTPNAVNRVTMTDYCFSRSDHDNSSNVRSHTHAQE